MEKLSNEEIYKRLHFDFRTKPTECSECKSKNIAYIPNKEIYGRSYGNGYCYICNSCNSYVGIHNTKSKIPLGRFANAELRKLKQECHTLFDPFWRTGKFKRMDCYGCLSEKLGLFVRETHFGWFDKEYLLKSIDILKTLTDQDIENYIVNRKIRKDLEQSW